MEAGGFVLTASGVTSARRGWSVPDAVVETLHRAGLELTEGVPTDTWNGLSADVHTVGAKGGGARYVHLLAPGVHPASAGEAQLRFAWNDARAALWQRMIAALGELRDSKGVTHVLAGGSFFTTDHPTPGDIDLLAIGRRSGFEAAGWATTANEFAAFNRAQGEAGVHLYPATMAGTFAGGPTMMSLMGHVPPFPRPPKGFDFANPGERVGMLLLDVDDLLRTAARDPKLAAVVARV